MRLGLLAILVFAVPQLDCGAEPATGDLGIACHLMNCSDKLVVGFEEPLEEGSYRIEVAEGDHLLGCDLVVPPTGPAQRCPAVREETQPPGRSAQAIWPLFSDDDALSGFSIWGSPAQVQITILRDGSELLSFELTPTYEDQFINGGPECGVDCRTAEVVVPLR